MTFDAETYQLQSQTCETGITASEDDEKPIDVKPITPPVRQKDATDDFCEDTQISNWEDEGGAYLDRTDALLRPGSVKPHSVLAVHMDMAEDLMISGDYDAAVMELRAAAEVFISYRRRINSSFIRSISHLSSLGCPATPPHPSALPLLKLHQQITP